MKRQGGFTLIEMIVVIVILGILAVTAAPKFLNFQDDARDASLEGLKAAMQSAASMAHGKYLIDNSYDDVEMANGYPAATAGGIGASVTLDGFATKTGATDGAIWYSLVDNAGNRCVEYTQATLAEGTTDASNATPPSVAVVECTSAN